MNNSGKYEDACTVARKSTGAAGTVLIIIDGKLGNGFSVQATREIHSRLPEWLEFMAQEIRKNLAK